MATPKAQQRRKDQGSPSTPLSPSVLTRREEKDQMVNLNNRLAVYIERIRSLETENSKLQIQVSAYEETNTREISNVKQMYEGEMKEARRLLDDIAKEKAQLQIEVSSLRDRADSEKTKCDGLTHDNSVLEAKLKDLSKRARAKEALATNALKEKEEAVAELEGSKAKVNDVSQELETVRKMLEGETLQRVDFENKLQSLREELQFKEKLFNEEVRESRKRQEVSLTEIEQQNRYDYEAKLEAAISDLREQQNIDIEQMKEDLEAQYKEKIEAARKQSDTLRKTLMSIQEGTRSSELKVDRLQTTIQTLQNDNSKLQGKIRDLEGKLEAAIELKRAAVAVVEEERDDIRMKLRTMEGEYAELLNLKLHLDLEISTYRKLLEEEEARLNISPSQVASDSKVRTRARRKRKRVGQTESQEVLLKQKKQDSAVTTTITSETVTVEQTSSQQRVEVGKEDLFHEQGDPQAADGEKSCSIM